MDVNEDGGLRPGYKLKLNSYDLGVDIELHDVLATHSIRASGNSLRDAHQREEPHFLLGRQHLYAGPFLACLESEFLQIHQRNPQRH